MRPVVITQTGAGTTAAVPLDRYISPFVVVVSCVELAAAVYSLQYTYDDVFNPPGNDAANITWITDTNIPLLSAGNTQTNFNVPIGSVRLVVVSGTVRMTVNQAGIA